MERVARSNELPKQSHSTQNRPEEQLKQQGSSDPQQLEQQHDRENRLLPDRSAATPPIAESNVSVEVVSPIETPIVRRRRRLHRRPRSPDRRRPSEISVVDYDADGESEEEDVRGRQRSRQAELSQYFGSVSAGPRLQAPLTEEPEPEPEVPIIAVPVPPGRGMAKLQRSKTYEPGALQALPSRQAKTSETEGIPIPPDWIKKRS